MPGAPVLERGERSLGEVPPELLSRDALDRRADDHTVVEDQGGSALGMAGREERGECGAFGEAEQGCALAAHGVHHGADVVHSLFEHRSPLDRVREPAAALVEEDEA